MNYIKSRNALKLFTRKFSPEIQAEMREAAEIRSAGDVWAGNQKIDAVRQRIALPKLIRAGVLLAWGFYTVAADSPLLLLAGIAAMISIPIQLIGRIL
ncbi:hypothetical protein [Sulfuricella sp.]|uniref:hypothetical protein n=1 Tax=Sulfuricella sp. TaxID=2099377 RepID=UPI002C7C5A9C|nr:hypothetical protein [Sulfuricella sp.]HUX64325.1 hypothetical protein [Sulfuricella sp.]